MVMLLIGHRLRRRLTPSSEGTREERRRVEVEEHLHCLGTVLMQVNRTKTEAMKLSAD